MKNIGGSGRFQGNNPGNGKWHNEGKGSITGTTNGDHLMGTTGAETINGDSGDDNLIAFAGADTLIGGADKDDLSGGAGADTLVGGTWTDTDTDGVVDAGEAASDADRDTFVAGSTHEEGVFDTIMDYVSDEDGDLTTDNEGDASDLIDLTDAFVFQATDTLVEGVGDGILDPGELEAALSAGGLAYNDETGMLSINGQDWFKVLAEDGSAADSVVVRLSVSLDGGTPTTVDYIL